MELIGILLFLFGIPIGGVLGARALRLFRNRWVTALGSLLIGATPGMILFVGAQESDSITSAASLFVAPVLILIGVALSSITALASSRS